MEEIETKRLRLIPISEADTENILRWRNSPSVASNFVFREPLTREMHENWLRTQVASGNAVQYMIALRESDMSIGSVYFRDVDRANRCAEFGIYIGEASMRGQGLGAETTGAFVRFGFERLGLHRIFLRVFDYNVHAIRCYENAGFTREGLFRDMVFLDGAYQSMVFMARLNPLL